jgi:hypothetical protein
MALAEKRDQAEADLVLLVDDGASDIGQRGLHHPVHIVQ